MNHQQISYFDYSTHHPCSPRLYHSNMNCFCLFIINTPTVVFFNNYVISKLKLNCSLQEEKKKKKHDDARSCHPASDRLASLEVVIFYRVPSYATSE